VSEGSQQNIYDCKAEILRKIQLLKNRLFNVMITETNMCNALQEMMREANFNKNYSVRVNIIGSIVP
jgi:hypothetical protein